MDIIPNEKNGIFQRREIKFMVSASQRVALEKVLSEHMVPDAYGESTIRNIYYDTADYRLIRRSLEKPVYKEKLRMRSYKTASGESKVFLELKKKYQSIVYKRRISLSLDDAERYMSGEIEMPDKSQIGREIDYFCKFYKGLRPSAFICYDRYAMFGRDDPSFRVTFDRNIRYRTRAMSLSQEPWGTDILPAGCSLMEVKTAEAIPLWLTKVMSEQHINQVSFSKYGEAYQQLCREIIEENGGFYCA